MYGKHTNRRFAVAISYQVNGEFIDLNFGGIDQYTFENGRMKLGLTYNRNTT